LSTPGLQQNQAGLENPNRQALIQLQAELSAFVHQECQAQKDKHHREWCKPIADRVKAGRCITCLSLENIREGRILHFRVRENDSDFREGDLVRISNGDPLDAICTGEFYREDLDSVEVILRNPSDWQPREPNSLFTLDHSYIDLEKFFQRAIDQLGESETGRDRILPLLSGDLKPSIDLQAYEEASAEAQQLGLNDTQAEAVAAASSTDLCQLIQGPPGTGKTHVLAQIVQNRLAQGERILVCAATHRAIHNALNKIAPLCPGQICKIDGKVFDPGLKVEQFEYFDSCPFAKAGGGYVIGATPYAVQGRLSGVEFDTIIMDEAGQITLPLAVMAMLAGQTYIFIGDHKQLPPVVVSRPADELCDISIFNRLHGRGFDETLNVTYRMNQELTAWPSEQFYFGDLTSHEKVANRRIQYPGQGKNFDDILAPEEPVVVVETSPGEDRTSSHEEAILIRDLLDELISERQLSQHDNYAPDFSGFLSNDKTSICIPPSVPFVLAILNSQVSFWFSRQTFASKQGGFYEFKPMYVSKVPILSATSNQQVSCERISEYLIWLNTPELARTLVGSSPISLMSAYFEQWLNGLVYELFFQSELHDRKLRLFDETAKLNLPSLDKLSEAEKLPRLVELFENAYDVSSPLRSMLFDLRTVETVRIIEGEQEAKSEATA
jgi:DNA replication ATP-dependent helicase Dna2